jgi:RNA polymerase sigma-70 factor (ECF subfamily)
MLETGTLRKVVVSGPWATRARDSRADSEHNDAALVELLQRDRVLGAAQIYDRFATTVNRLVWHLLGADADHDDLVQQVFYKVLLHATKLRDPSRLAAWVQSTAVNTVYEELRRRQVRRLFLREQTLVRFHPDVTHDVEARDCLRRTRALIERLSPKDRIVFVLHFVEERTLDEIAVLCGYSVRTAKRRLASANRSFGRLVAQQPDLAPNLAVRREEP